MEKVLGPAGAMCGLTSSSCANHTRTQPLPARAGTIRTGTGTWVGAAATIAAVFALATGPAATAEPGEPAPSPPQPGSPVAVEPVVADAAGETKAACSRFGEALDLAAYTYSDFADATAGDQWKHSDPVVRDANVYSRTALRSAAADAWSASVTPGLNPDIAARMRNWSMHAAKLAVSIGIRRDSDALNVIATELNDDTFNVQMACAQNGTRP